VAETSSESPQAYIEAKKEGLSEGQSQTLSIAENLFWGLSWVDQKFSASLTDHFSLLTIRRHLIFSPGNVLSKEERWWYDLQVNMSPIAL
jgi:hypothetical protein